MQIITLLNEILTQKGISVLKFSKEADIPEGRVYKWLDPETKAKPKSDDVEKIEKWINSKKLENVPPGTKTGVSRQDEPGMHYTPITSTDRQHSNAARTVEDQLIGELKVRIKSLEADNEFLRKQNEKLMSMLDNSLQKS